MSLQTDIIFVKALRSNDALIHRLAAKNVYNTTIALPDEDFDNAPLPYVIVSFNGLNNDQTTKDDYEGDTDTVNIGVEIAAKTRPELGNLSRQVRKTIHDYFAGHYEDSDVPIDYQFSAQAVMYDSLKPCFWQSFNYQCSCTNNLEQDDNEQD